MKFWWESKVEKEMAKNAGNSSSYFSGRKPICFKSEKWWYEWLDYPKYQPNMQKETT